jgi:hypothetical protein
MRFRSWLAIAVLLALPVFAWAQVVVNDGASTRGQTSLQVVGGLNRSSDTTGRAIKVNASGQVAVDDEDRDRDLVSTWSDIIPVDSLRAAGDSSAVIQLGGARHLFLAIKGCPKGPHSITFTRVALQFRTHINSQTDSSSTIPLFLYGIHSQGVTVGTQDTLTVGQLSVAGSATAPWSEEVVVTFDRRRCGPDGSTSATLFYPGGIGLPLDSYFGREVRLSNISIRARVIGGVSLDNPTFTLMGFGK